MAFTDFHPAPNQGGDPALYELENRAVDPDGLVLAAMPALAPWAGKTLVDLGCGSGYWLPGYADEAGTEQLHDIYHRIDAVIRESGLAVEEARVS